MGLCPSPPGSGLPGMNIPSGPWEDSSCISSGPIQEPQDGSSFLLHIYESSVD